ncbi:MAG: hypothetical protein L0338_24520 [Acidobacteria bacterium]|nr:hypothetical protein [Acidobacteriota bacterium]
MTILTQESLPLTITIITSAAVGAIVSTLITLLGQYLEREARRRELLFTKAIEMAVQHTEILMRVAEKSGKAVYLYDNVVKAERYHRWLCHLYERGELPPEAQKFRAPGDANEEDK